MGSGRPDPVDAITVETVTVTCCIDDRAHEILDTELAMAATRRNGYCRALCGHMIAAAPMVMPDGQPCQLCAAIRDRNTTRFGGVTRRRLAGQRRIFG